jgi:hypothetical protein
MDVESKIKGRLKKSALGAHHYIDGNRVLGVPSRLEGDVTGLRMNVNECCILEEARTSGIDVGELVRDAGHE